MHRIMSTLWFPTPSMKMANKSHKFRTKCHKFRTKSHKCRTKCHKCRTKCHKCRTKPNKFPTKSHKFPTKSSKFPTKFHKFPTKSSKFQTKFHKFRIKAINSTEASSTYFRLRRSSNIAASSGREFSKPVQRHSRYSRRLRRFLILLKTKRNALAILSSLHSPLADS